MMNTERATKDTEQIQILEKVWFPMEQSLCLVEIFESNNSLMESLSGKVSGGLEQE